LREVRRQYLDGFFGQAAIGRDFAAEDIQQRRAACGIFNI
jgi:hypothetical protein